MSRETTNKTISYYDNFTDEYFKKTINANMHTKYEEFLKYLPKGSKILDLGCGSGRDSLYFIGVGYKVTAIDGSKRLSSLAAKYIGQEVRNIEFENIDEICTYDGVWACASLLHLEKNEMPGVLKKIYNALKEKGILYVSLKLGKDNSYYEKGRYYTYYKEETLIEILEKSNFRITEKFKSMDELKRDAEWINVIARKI